MSDLHNQSQGALSERRVPSRSHQEPHLYRVAFQFYARDQAEAMEIVNGSLLDAPKITFTIENLDRRRMQHQILWAGITIGFLVATVALACIAGGVWR